MNKAPLTSVKSWPSFMLIGRLLSEIDHPPYFLYRIMSDPLLNLPEIARKHRHSSFEYCEMEPLKKKHLVTSRKENRQIGV